MMATKQSQKPLGLISTVETGQIAPGETGLRDTSATPLIPPIGTARRYSKRARKCKCGCGQMVAPTAKNPNKMFFDDNCRKRYHRRQEAKQRKSQPVPAPVLVMYTCAFCEDSFLATEGKGAKYCKPSHTVAAAEHRRYAATLVFVEGYGMPVDEAQNMIENSGMKNVSAYLRQQGYAYDETARRWVMAVQAGDVFADRGSHG